MAIITLGLRSAARKLSQTSSTLDGGKYDLMLNFAELDGRFVFQLVVWSGSKPLNICEKVDVLMDFNEWTLAPDGRSASHSCGFTLSVEGNPRDPQGVNPGRFPANMSVIDQARLLRHGVEAIAKGAQRGASASPVNTVPSPAVRQVSDRPVLSIKRNSSDTETPA